MESDKQLGLRYDVEEKKAQSESFSPDEALILDYAVQEKRLLRKLDLRIIPVLWFLFLVSFVDRGNLGNAKIEGIIPDLNMKGNKYNMAVMVFTLTYVAFQLPANIAFKRYGTWVLSLYMFIWGICCVCQGVTESFAGLIVCRLLMGAFEAGFVPGCAYLIGSYYKRNEYLRRYVIFFSAMMAAGAFNGLLARCIEHMDGIGGYEGWRWIFILEGLFTVVTAVCSYFLIVPFPEKCTFLTPIEKKFMLERLAADGANVKNDKLHLFTMMKDWKIWFAIFGYLGAQNTASSIVAFQPTILKSLGWSSASAQVHSIPIYAVAFVVSLSCAFLSDHLKLRYPFTIFGMCLCLIGWSIELAHVPQAELRYMGMFFVAAGAYTMMPIIVVWTAINLGKGYKRTVGLAMLIGLGNCGAFISSNVFITSEGPEYKTGFSVGIGLNMMGGVAVTILFLGLIRENHRRDKLQTSGQVPTDIPLEDLGEEHPNFRYQI
ncbi:MAG: hypothetical protein M1834_001698 [Cirrosporium novae-zelandiae]|nr:MAG: hypothetical protein M1834_001698 [Cirrosporium novae-zelandiae]